MKIWSKLFLVAATGMMMFSSCLENIEPEGIADLRGAKAELLRAQTALAEANAAKVNADAAFVQAQAKIQEAIAKQEEAKVAYYEAQALLAQYEAEYQALENAAYEAEKAIELEQKMAEAQAAIAEAEALAAVYAAELERDLLLVQAEIAAAQKAYESALKDLAIAKNSLTDTQKEAIAALETAVSAARDDVETKTLALENAARQLAAALAEVDEVKANKLNMRMAELKLVGAQAALEGAQKAEAEAKAALELDPSVTDWEAKAEAYKAEIEKLDSEWYKKDGEIDDAMATKNDSVTRVIKPMADDYFAHTGYKLNEATGLFSKIKTQPSTWKTFPIDEVVVTAPVDEEGKPLFGGDFVLQVYNSVYKYDEEKDVIEMFENKLKNLAKTYTKEVYEAKIALAEAQIVASQNEPMHKYKVTKYNDAVAAYKAGDVLAYFNKYVFDEDFDLTVAVTEYNEALKAMEDAVKNFNDKYDKYNPDYSEEYEAALAAQTKAYNDAAVVKAQEYQKAEDDNKYTYNKNVVWADAQEAWKKAQDKFTSAEEAVNTVMGGMTAEEMATFVENYDEETATEEDKELYAAYTAALEVKKEAEEAKTTAKVEYDKAEAAWKKVDEAYKKAITAADDKEATAKKKADEDYNKAYAAIQAKTPTFDPTYMVNLFKQVTDAKTVVQNKVNAIANKGSHFGEFDDQNVEFELNIEFPAPVGKPVVTVTTIPEFMLETTYDGTDYVYTMKSVAVSDFVDKEYFKDNVITDLVDDLTEAKVKYNYSYRDSNGEFHSGTEATYTWTLDGEDYDGYPLELPSAEEYEKVVGNLYAIPADVSQTIWSKYGWGTDNYDLNMKAEVSAPSYYAEVTAEMEIAGHKAMIENLKMLPDFVKAIEAAQAEFEALVKENADKLAAAKAEVEAFYAEYIELKEKYEAELEAIVAENNVVKARYNAMIQTIADYCYAKNTGSMTVDDLIKALQDNYADAVKTVIFAEETVRQAEQAIEDVKAGIVTAADAAQRAYDRAAEELAEAIAKLERAAADLEAVIAAIYGEEAEETPAE